MNKESRKIKKVKTESKVQIRDLKSKNDPKGGTITVRKAGKGQQEF